MKKLLILFLIIIIGNKSNIISKANSYYNSLDIQNSLTEASEIVDKILGYKKETEENYNEIKNIITYIKNKQDIFTKIYDNEVKDLFNKLTKLEETYNEKLLKSYGVNIEEYKKELEKNNYDEEFKKQYIMKNANISEDEYNEKFINPFNKIKEPSINDNMTLKEINNIYKKYFKDKITYINKLISK